MLWVKICGMTNAQDALVAAEAGADAIGMLFAPSKRRITIEQGREIARALPKTIEKVGVFYDEATHVIEQITNEVGLTAIQLHGDESPEFARSLFKGSSRRTQIRIFKTLHVTDGFEEIAREFLRDQCVDGFLLDSVVLDAKSGEVSRGGTGQIFDWRSTATFLPVIRRETRVIVAGGLSPANVEEAVRLMQPWGVDICSGVESAPGKKDHKKVREFVSAARAARN